MKTAAIICLWNDQYWAPYALKQASDFCDDVFVVEGCHSQQFPERSTDCTRDIAVKASEECGNVHLLELPFTRDENDITSQRYDHYQAAVWNWLLQQVKNQTGAEWFRPWDADMIFVDADLEKIIDHMQKTDAFCLRFNERRFIYNFRFCTEDVTGNFYKVTKGAYFTPISKLHFADGDLYPNYAEVMEDVTVHHFTGVRQIDRMKARFDMSSEKGTPGARQNWRDWRDLKWAHDDDFIAQFEPMAERILGGKNLQVYDGPWPECLEGHPWREIEDVRKWRRFASMA